MWLKRVLCMPTIINELWNNMKMLITFVITAASIFITWFITHMYYKKSSKETPKWAYDIHGNDPNIALLDISSKNIDNAFLRVKNIGNKSAYSVKLIFDSNSHPSTFSANPIECIDEIKSTTTYNFPMKNLFFGIKMFMDIPNSDKSYKENLKKVVHNFKEGREVLIPKFYIEYKDENENLFYSDLYYLVIDYEKGIVPTFPRNHIGIP